MDFLYSPATQIALVVILVGLGIWWFKFRPQY